MSTSDPASASPPPSSPPPSSPPPPITYVVKRIIFNGKKVPVALQNTNGPCPLLAVANILSLRGHFSIHEDKSVVTAEELLAAVSDYLFDANTATSDALNHERNVNDVIQMLPNTLVGIDVNIKFDTLVHGWLVDPQDAGYAFIQPLSYNQLVDKELERISNTGMRSPPRSKLFVQGSPSMAKLSLNPEHNSTNIAGPSNLHKHNNESNDNIPIHAVTTTTTASTASSEDHNNTDQLNNDVHASSSSTPVKSNPTSDFPDRGTQALLAEQFLNETATQLTYHGLTELHSGLRDEELCVFFRNNHFNTLYKHNGELFVLVTDQGYALEPIAWERLCQIDGDSTFLNSDFTMYQASSPVIVRDGIAESKHESEDRDLALALQLQDEENKRNPPSKKVDRLPYPDELKQKKEKKKDCIMQ